MDALSFATPPPRRALEGTAIFLSASIPDPDRWHGDYDALEITDAVVAFGRLAMAAGMKLVTAAHPTIAPLLLYVAAELPEGLRPEVFLYQSEIFKDVMPTATQRFVSQGIAIPRMTEAVEGEDTDPANRGRSLELMRRQMFAETKPAAACFVGGMEGIADEFELFREFRPGAPTYPLAGPGGEAARLIGETATPLEELLARSQVYPTVWNRVLDDLEGRL